MPDPGIYKPVSDADIAAAMAMLSPSAGGEIGTVTQPTSGSIAFTVKRLGPLFIIDFILTAARIPVTDGAASGSQGTLPIFNFAQAGIAFLGSRQNYTAFAEGAALTTGAGDAVHVLGLGSAALATARDGTLTGTEQDIGTVTSQITNSGGTGAGTKHTGAVTAAADGTSTAIKINLNWSGTAATIDANSNIDVTGTITVVGVFLGDD